MIRVIESLSNYPMRFMPDKEWIDKLEPGMIVQTIMKNGTPVVIPSDGTRPLGVVGDSVGREIYDLVPVWFDTMIFRTDKFVLTDDFVTGNALYVKSGLLTNKCPFEDAIIVGHVVSALSENGDKIIEVSWI